MGRKQNWTRADGYWGWAIGLWRFYCPILLQCVLFSIGNKIHSFLTGLEFLEFSHLCIFYYILAVISLVIIRSKCRRGKKSSFQRDDL